MSKTIYMRYWTPNGYIVRIMVDSIGFLWKANTNDFDGKDHSNSFYHQHIADLEWTSKPEAQADLDEIAKRLKLQEAGAETPYTEYIRI